MTCRPTAARFAAIAVPMRPRPTKPIFPSTGRWAIELASVAKGRDSSIKECLLIKRCSRVRSYLATLEHPYNLVTRRYALVGACAFWSDLAQKRPDVGEDLSCAVWGGGKVQPKDAGGSR